MATHVKVVGALFIVFGAGFFLLAIASSFFAGGLAGLISASGEEGAPLGATIVGVTGAAIALTMTLAAIPSVICGWGLLTGKSWARILGIVLAVLAAINPPIGTLFGIYALIVLFNKDTQALLGPKGA